MLEMCEVCGKEFEGGDSFLPGVVIYFCSRECELKMTKVMERGKHPVRFVLSSGKGGCRDVHSEED